MNTPREVKSAQHESNLRNLEGTFAAEGLKLSQATQKNLERIANGQASYQQIIDEIIAKYERG